MDKILIGTVTSIYKDYCWDDFKRQLTGLQKLGYDVLIIDNSFKKVGRGFKTKYVQPRGDLQIVTRDSMEVLRKEFLKGDYTHLMILESDVFIKANTVDKMLKIDADIVNHTYPMNLERFDDFSLCIQGADTGGKWSMLTPEESKDLLNTGLKILGADTHKGKTLMATGYGCTLVKRKVLENIEFRAIKTPEGKKPFPDSTFHLDVFNKGYKNVLDTDFVPIHKNLHNETKLWMQVVKKQNTTTRAERRKKK